MSQRYQIDDLLYLMARLRDPSDGCDWDKAQTMQSITHYTLEECYELIDAIELNDIEQIRDELGDVLFQVIFYSQVASEAGSFDWDDVVHGIVSKLVRRHPHVFPAGTLQSRATNSEISQAQIKTNWEAIKQTERDAKAQSGILDDVPTALPALSRAQKLQKRAAKVGFDWQNAEQVIDTLNEEISELRAAIKAKQPQNIQDEAGDVLFSAVNLSRHLGLDAEKTLRQSNNKFEQRVQIMESLAREMGQELAALSLEQQDELWAKAKRQLGSS